MSKNKNNNVITVNDLIDVLSRLPQSAKQMKIRDMRGTTKLHTELRLPGFRIEVKDCDDASRYILIPFNKGEELQDSFGTRYVN